MEPLQGKKFRDWRISGFCTYVMDIALPGVQLVIPCFLTQAKKSSAAQKVRLLQFLKEMGSPWLFASAVLGRAFPFGVPVPYRMPGSLQREHIRDECPGAMYSTA